MFGKSVIIPKLSYDSVSTTSKCRVSDVFLILTVGDYKGTMFWWPIIAKRRYKMSFKSVVRFSS
jgi:hypothetical protein